MQKETRTEPFVLKDTLANGVTVATREMPNAQSVAIGVFIDVGSRDESVEQEGISHALEHMVFKGTDKLDVHQLAESLDGLGGNANAFTSRERTCFHLHVLHEDWQEAVGLLSGMLLHPALPEDEWLREREVIFSEMSMVDDAPDEWVYDQHISQVYAGQSMGKPVLGTKKVLNALEVQGLRDYLDSNYRGSNVLIATAGRIKHQDMLTVINQSEWKDATGQKRKTRSKAKFCAGRHQMPRQMEQAQVVASWKSIHVASPEKPVAWVANQLLGGSMSSILFREIREKRGLAYSVGSHLSTYTDAGLLGISCSTMPEQLEPCLNVLNETISDVCSSVPLDMVVRAKRQLVVQFRMGMDSVEGAMLQLGALLDEDQVYSPLEWVEKVNGVEPEQVQVWLKKQLETEALWTISAPSAAL
ncbi:MAG: pitrilysin family protein [Ghiorsea sp.]